MSFTRITNAELNSRGATTLPNQPTISASALKQEFDAPAKEVVAPKVNNLMDELEAVTGAASLGAVAPTGRTGSTVQGVLNSVSTGLSEVEVASHTHTNKTIIDRFADDGTGLTYNGSPISGAVESVNGKTGAVELDASDVGALPDDTAIPTKTSELTNDSGFIDSSALDVKVDKVTGKGLSTNDYDNTAKAIVDGATAAIAAKSTVTYSQTYSQAGQKIGEITIDGVKTDIIGPNNGGGGGGGAVDSVNGQTGTVVLDAADVGALPDSTTIPTKVSDLTNDSGYQTASDVSTAISGKADSATTLAGYGITNAYTKSEVDSALGGKASASDVSAIQGLIPSSATTSNKLATASDIPAAAKDGTLTITQNGTTKGTFSADQSTDDTINIVTDEWSSPAQVSSGSVSFTIPSNTFGYDLYCERPNVSVTNVAVNGTTVTYTLSGAQNGDNCKLRILK